MITLAEFYDMLEAHDWYHMMSDDRSVDEHGAANWRKLNEIAADSANHIALLAAYSNYMYSGPPWENEKAPKPERPKENV